MCYDISQQKLREIKEALRNYAPDEVIEKLTKEYEKLIQGEGLGFHVNGFTHQHLYTAIKQNELIATRFQWGLIPHWVKDKETAMKIWNQTLNARGETIFEKPSFRDSAKSKRCLIFVDGFFEHHHKDKNVYPFFIERIDKAPIVFGGLWSEWVDKTTGEIYQTTTIVTTTGNELMSKIHNNPKADGARMPLILESDQFDIWLESKNQLEIQSTIRPLEDGKLKAHSVRKLKGKEAVGDIEEVREEFIYTELGSIV